ncbi:MAG: transcriptional repressor LexA [Bacillota bacterium]
MTNKIDMKSKLNEVYSYIANAIEKRGFPPSVREIKDAFGFSSTASVHYYMKKLKEDGLIKSDYMKSRSIELTNDNSPKARDFARIPVVGDIAAGAPILAVEEYNEVYHIPHGLFNSTTSAETFFLRVKGDSMIDVGIYNGDYILIRKQNTAKNGDIVAVLVGDESATVKRLFIKPDNKIVLHPENSTMSDMTYHASYVSIIGLVVGLIRTRI